MRALAKTLMMIVALLLVAAAGVSAQAAPPARSTTVIVVRHAEKADDSRDPLLSEAGSARAQKLAALLEHAGVSSVITTQYQRTRLTAQPAADKAGVTITQVPAGNPMQRHLDDIVARVRENAGGTVLIVGHSNTVPLIVSALGGPDVGTIEESEYANMFTLVIDGAAVRLVRSAY